MNGPKSEVERFVSIFGQQVQHGWDFVARIPPGDWSAVPVDSETMFLGTRVNRISISALVRHLCVAEMHWFSLLPDLAAGGTLPIPPSTHALDDVEGGEALISRYRDAHLAALASVRSWPPELLEKKFTFVGLRFTVMGFLWAIHGHHGFHLGQIDLLLRQVGRSPPEYMEWHERRAVIA